MECKLLLTEAGIIILNKNNELLYSKRFPVNKELQYYSDFKTGKISDFYEQLLIDLNNIDITILQTDQSNFISLLKSSNINFKIEIAMMVNELESRYKIGFVSRYSDYFYNVQLKAKGNNVYEPIKDIIS